MSISEATSTPAQRGMTALNGAALNSADDCAVIYEIYPKAPWGGRTIQVSRERFDEYRRDPDGVAAWYFGVPKGAYREWVELDGRPLCAARTKRGTQCRNWCGRSFHDDAVAWLAAHRAGYCPTHGGELFGWGRS
jgi:hypothetical protein